MHIENRSPETEFSSCSSNLGRHLVGMDTDLSSPMQSRAARLTAKSGWMLKGDRVSPRPAPA